MEGLQKRHVTKEVKENFRSGGRDGKEPGDEDDYATNKDEPKLSLMEELLLIVMDPKGFVSIWNDNVSRALRGCILIELWMRGKIELEPAGMRRKSISRRTVILKNTTPTDDCILNEALKVMKDSPSAYPVADWISYLSGETWNPMKLKLHMRNVRDRIFKDLVERGILSTVKKNYWLVDVKSHPIRDFGVKKQVMAKVKDALLENYTNDLRRVDKRTLTLLILAQYSGVIDDCLTGLPSDLERLALRRMQDLEGADFEAESRRGNETELHWAVYAALNDPYVVL